MNEHEDNSDQQKEFDSKEVLKIIFLNQLNGISEGGIDLFQILENYLYNL